MQPIYAVWTILIPCRHDPALYIWGFDCYDAGQPLLSPVPLLVLAELGKKWGSGKTGLVVDLSFSFPRRTN